MKFVKIKEITPAKTEPVYHLKVDKNHNFFANNLCVHNCDYTGEIKIILINHGEYRFAINNGDRIAQAVVASVIGKNVIKMIQVDNIDKNTDRSDGGFGHTGVK